MAASHDEIFARWFAEKHKPKPKFVRGSKGNGLHVTPEGVLSYGRTGGHRRRTSPHVQIGRWVGGKNGYLLMNAEAFADFNATRWQNNIRTAAQRGRPAIGARQRYGKNPSTGHWEFRTIPNSAVPAVEALPQERALLVPFAAVESANIDFQSIRPIEVLADLNENRTMDLPDVRVMLKRAWLDERVEKHGWELFRDNPSRNLSTYEGSWQSKRWRVTLYDQSIAVNDSNRIDRVTVWERPEHGIFGWQQVRNYVTPTPTWVARIHRMGASLFSAAVDGHRYKFVSAFDQNEPRPLYFLATLPRGSAAKTVDEAIMALAPPIVHAAWENNVHVERQGDVFAVATDLTDEQVYDGAVSRVRRSVALQVPQANMQLEPPAGGEVREKHNCPHCGEFTWMGFGPRAKRSLMIHGTGHTADEVVKKPGGVTYVKGALHHDPQLETEGRRPDHVARALEEGRWYLAVRNTVPRLRNRRERAVIARSNDGVRAAASEIRQAA